MAGKASRRGAASKSSGERTKRSGERTKRSGERTKKSGERTKKSGERTKKSGERTKAAKSKAKKPTKAAKSKAAKPKATKPKAAKPTRRAREHVEREAVELAEAVAITHDAVPTPIGDEQFSTGRRRRAMTARDWSTRSSPVVEILDDPHPIGALRRFLDSIKGAATEQQAQIALGSAQLMLLPIAREARGGAEVKELVDLVLERWADFGAMRIGFHAQEFLRNAFAAVGVDRDRISRLEAVVPVSASSELLFHVAGAHAVARDKVAMLRAVEAALAAGTAPADFRRDHDFAPYTTDPDLAVLLARADLPTIPVDVDPYLPAVRGALDALVASLTELGESVELRPPVRLDTILDMERAARISLPNDYRALLSTTNGMRVWDREFLATADFREPTQLAMRARRYLQAEYATAGLSDCVPLATWGGPNDWLLYDPRGRVRRGDPGYVVMLDSDEIPVADLAAALVWLEALARDERGTN
jgi:hypothetical protein